MEAVFLVFNKAFVIAIDLKIKKKPFQMEWFNNKMLLI